MEAKITSYRTLQIYPSEYNKDEKVAETIFIEDILKLKNEGDSILLTRRNASGLSCLAYLESRPVEKLVMPKIAEEKLMLQWKESKMIGGEPVYYLDESHAVCIKDYIDQVEIWFFERTQENGKYYCRVTKKHFLDARKIKENYEILLNA